MKYRIVSNGIEFRVQWFGKSCFWQRHKWRFLLRDHIEGACIAEFDSRDEANGAILYCRRKEEARKKGFQPV